MLPAKNYIAVVIMLVLPFVVKSQQGKTSNLHSVISFLNAKYGVVLSYDVELTKDVPVEIDTTQSSLKNILHELNSETAFHFELLNSRNVLVKPKFTGQNFIITGTVFDKKTQELLLGTIIYQSNAKYGVYADESGNFHKAIKYNHGDSIVVSSIGYEKAIYPLSYFTGGAKKIALQSQRIQMNEVAVTAYLTTGVSYDATDNSINIRPKNLSILPGSVNGDVLGALDAMPGISSTDGKAGSLNIRGSSPDQTQINVDNIPVYLKGHFFGSISPVNPNAVDQIKVQRSTMSVDKGGRAGGLIDIHTANNVTNKLHATVSSSAMDGNVYVHTPVLKDKISVAVSGRHSYPFNNQNPAFTPISNYLFQRSEIRPLFDGTSADELRDFGFDYSDANVKVNYNISPKHKGSVSGLFIQNDMYVDRNSLQNNSHSFDEIRMHNWGLNTSLYSAWTPRFNTFFSLTHSLYNQTFDALKLNYTRDSIKTKSLFENQAQDSRLLFESDYKISNKFVLKTGYDGRLQNVHYLRATNNNSNTSFMQNFKNNGIVNSIYSTLSGNISKKLFANVGLRANHYSLTGEYSFEPRAFLKYSVNDFFRLKASGGYQKQFVVQLTGVNIESIGGLDNQLWMLADDEYIPVVNSFQGTFGGMFEKSSWLIDLEGYYRDVMNVTSVSLTTPLREFPFIHGGIKTAGADLLVRKQWKSIDAWVSYSYSDSRMQFDSINDGASFTSIYDQTHILDIAGSYRIGQFKFSMGWKYRTGLDALPSIRTRMLSGAPTTLKMPPPSPGQQPTPKPPPPVGYTGRFPDYHQLDVSVYYNFPKEVRGFKGSVGISVMNCYNQENIIEQSPQGNTVSSRLMPLMAPNLFITLSF